MADPTRTQARTADVRLRGLTLAAFVAPLVVLAAVFGTRFGLWSAGFGLEVLTLKIGRILAFAGLAAALVAVIIALKDVRRRGLYAAVSLAVAGATVALFLVQQQRFAVPADNDVTTDPTEAPAFSRAVLAMRGGAGAGGGGASVACPDLVSVPRQVAPETAAAALSAAGFTVRGAAPFRADGAQEGFWFGLTYDAAIRIRPGRTDVRVAQREGVSVGDEACRLAQAVVQGLAPQG
ncbi:MULTISPECIES: DUF1499 domain-containing protein [unclassified Brevundimonas]|uniref:DUF1499 domain-containing protein n=1 Tax=unclassified Brevundimonas TaxID=2622653 RepID=UPI0025C3035A|nr:MULTISPECIES: DUF1499 domain-containing protein [unclassified Brevundimonas]